MQEGELQRLTQKVEAIVDDLMAAKATNKVLTSEKKKLEQELSSISRQLRHNQKEGDRIKELVAQNKAYKKTCALLKSRVISLLAKIDGFE